MIYIIRHGQTELNSRGVLQGRSDHALNETGIAQAREAAERLRDIPFSVVWSSPLVWALQTAEIIAPGLTPNVDDRLIEMDYGPYEGADLHNLPQEVITFFRDFVGRVYGGALPLGGKHPDLHPRHRHEGHPGISDAGLRRHILVEVHRQL